MPPRKPSTGKRELCHGDPMYTEKRSKNNDAVKKSREKTRMKAKETMEKVSILKQVKKIIILHTFLRNKQLLYAYWNWDIKTKS